MRINKKYLNWCAKQKKGIRIIKGSENLQKAYLGKSNESIRSMEINAREGISEWAISASYYAKYFAIYALLSRIGVKCEIHDCTIALFSYLFSDELEPEIIESLKQAKQERIEVQYYTTIVDVNIHQMVVETRRFVLKIEEIIDGLNTQRITNIQKKLKAAL
jgi:uncharacterized protein (UPF0332 family)